jgi:hypothetical protein
MLDESDPPRKVYGFKPADEFERANDTTQAPSAGPTDVAGMIKSANADPRALGGNAPVNRPNEVHAILQDNLRRADEAGLNKVKLDPNYRSKRYRRVRLFILFVIFFDGPAGFLAWKVGHENAVLFTFTLAAVAFFTARLAWETFFLNTE